MIQTREKLSAFITTKNNVKFYPLDPEPDDILIDDIAWSLSMQCRYAGHIQKFLSVAEHSYHISYLVPSEFALYGLLHDATEAYLVDLPRPVKNSLPEYKVIEDKLMLSIAEKFGLQGSIPPEVKAADTRILYNERALLMPNNTHAWVDEQEPYPDLVIPCWDHYTAYKKFMNRFNWLYYG